jgi:hypothetical protein
MEQLQPFLTNGRSSEPLDYHAVLKQMIEANNLIHKFKATQSSIEHMGCSMAAVAAIVPNSECIALVWGSVYVVVHVSNSSTQNGVANR